MHACIHSLLHTYIHEYIDTYTHSCVRACIQIHKNVRTCLYSAERNDKANQFFLLINTNKSNKKRKYSQSKALGRASSCCDIAFKKLQASSLRNAKKSEESSKMMILLARMFVAVGRRHDSVFKIYASSSTALFFKAFLTTNHAKQLSRPLPI